MTVHAEDPLRCSCISEVFNLSLTIPALEAGRTERLVASQNSQILNFIPAATAAVCAVVAYQRSIAEQEQVGVGVEEGAASVASKAIDVPSVSSYH